MRSWRDWSWADGNFWDSGVQPPLGTRLADALEAARLLDRIGLSATVADARFAKPVDTDLIAQLAGQHPMLVTIEEGAAGGFGAAVMQFLSWEGLLDHGLIFRAMTLPDRFIDHDTQEHQIATTGLSAWHISEVVRQTFDRRGKTACRL